MTALVDRVRSWLVAQGREADAPGVSRALDELGVVADGPGLARITERLLADLVGVGALQPLLESPEVTDVLVNGPHQVWVDRGAGLRHCDITFTDDLEVRMLAQRLAAQAGRRLDDATPFVDARLPGGVRLHAVLPPLSWPGTLISLRIPARRSFDLAGLVAAGAVSAAGAAWLRALVRSRCGYLVTGATGSGKTTVLRCLLELVPPDERIVAIEESAELDPEHPHFVRLEARMPNAEDQGAVPMRDLMRQAMRMRPDRIVVGEVRGAEVAALLNAMNTGHEGSCGTVHANSAAALPARLEALGLAADMDRAAVHSQMAAGLDAVLHVCRESDGRRRVQELGVVTIRSGQVGVVPLLSFRADRPRLTMSRHPVAARLLRAL